MATIPITTKPRDPAVITGHLAECVERLQRLVIPHSSTVDRMAELIDELQEALLKQQLEGSKRLLEAQR